MGIIVVLILRLLIPLTIFRWPLWGSIASMLADAFDQKLVQLLGSSPFPILGHIFWGDYQRIDKLLDMYYLSFELIIALRWRNYLLRTIAIILFAWRAIGWIIFELGGPESVLVATPNIFEYFFLFVLIVKNYFPEIKLKFKAVLASVMIMTVIKIPQEYVLHKLNGSVFKYAENAIARAIK
jgi:hypothetical protein